MSLKIIGGLFRNRSLKAPKGEKTRPTLAIMRKAVFDILQTSIEEAEFLDLYAGSGAMGLEALSRGASHCTFVEKDKNALRSINENIQLLALQKQTTVLGYDLFLALKKLVKEKKSFDIVYIDPPYALNIGHVLLKEIIYIFDSTPLLKGGGILFMEDAAPATLPVPELNLNSLLFKSHRKFSGSILYQFEKA